MSEVFVIGEVVRLSAKLTDMAGQPADPGSVTLKIKPGVGAVAAYTFGQAVEIIRDGVGAYHADIALTSSGQWAYRWELSGANSGACEGVFAVQKSRVI